MADEKLVMCGQPECECCQVIRHQSRATKARIAELEAVLTSAKTKLDLYRAQHSGEYVGGVEYTELIARIDAVLSK